MSNSEEQKNEAPGQNKEFEIVVNGRAKVVADKKLSFAQIAELAFEGGGTGPNIVYTVTYSKGEDKKPKGSMVDGDTVTIKSGMIFNVTRTDKS